MNLLILFIVLNAVNVIIQTIKSLLTIKGGKLIAASANAIAYGLYTVVVIYMVCELPLLWKVLIIGACNFIGVFVVKLIEERLRKEKLWKIEVTIPSAEKENLLIDCERMDLTFNYIDIHKYFIFNFYCETKEESKTVKEMLANYKAKYFVSESKILA